MIIDPVDRMEMLLEQGGLVLSQEFLAGVTAAQDSIDLQHLADLLQSGRFEEAFAIVTSVIVRLGRTWGDVYHTAGRDTGDFLTTNEIVIGYDVTNYRAVAAIQDNQLRLIQGFGEQQRRATQQALVRGITEGVNPIDMARAFRESIGLTPKQEEWVANYRRNLENLDRQALDRALRDKRFDSIVEQAIKDGRPIPKAKIDRLVKEYRDRMIKYRAETIGRTEALRAAHAGVHEMYMQAIEDGALDVDQLVAIWNTAGDERVRYIPQNQSDHRILDGQQHRIDEPFVSGAGNMALFPGTFGAPEDDIDCRCVRSMRILTPAEVVAATVLA